MPCVGDQHIGVPSAGVAFLLLDTDVRECVPAPIDFLATPRRAQR